jgi:hypothetical protein
MHGTNNIKKFQASFERGREALAYTEIKLCKRTEKLSVAVQVHKD